MAEERTAAGAGEGDTSLRDGLSAEASDLLSELGNGDGKHIGIPSVYPGLRAFSTHAMAYFETATALCREPRTHDFTIFGVLYCLRHGLELWLKFVVQAQVLDDVLTAILHGKAFDDVVAAAETRCSHKREREARKQQLVEALCFLRNLDAGFGEPERRTKDINETHAREMLATGENLNSLRLSLAWPVPVHGHGLLTLWSEATAGVVAAYEAEAAYYDHVEARPTTPARLGTICELFGKLDPSGDAFRYPNSLAGKRFTSLPPLNLRTLGALAQELGESARWYEDRIAPS